MVSCGHRSIANGHSSSCSHYGLRVEAVVYRADAGCDRCGRNLVRWAFNHSYSTGICVGGDWGSLPVHPELWTADLGDWPSHRVLLHVGLDEVHVCADPVCDYRGDRRLASATLFNEADGKGVDMGVNPGADRAGHHYSLLGCTAGATFAGYHLHVSSAAEASATIGARRPAVRDECYTLMLFFREAGL